MRKVTIRYNEKLIEVDLTDEEVYALVGLTQKPVSVNREAIQLPGTKYATSITTGGKKTRVKRLMKNPDEWELITQSVGESPARDGGADYSLYRHKINGELVGIIKSKDGHVDSILLGRPDEVVSRISLITRAVTSMPYYEAFSRRQLSELLPNSIVKRGEVMKFAFDYLEKKGVVVKLKEKDPSTRAILYKRLNEKRDAPAAQSGEESAEAIPR